MFALDDPRVLEVVTADPTRVVRAPGPVLIDEWQRYPPIWDAVRRAVDADPSPGRFILTGSASPQSPGTHSGAGRILALRMRPLTLAERGIGTPTVSLAALLDGPGSGGARVEVGGETSVALEEYTEAILTAASPGYGPRAAEFSAPR